VSTEADPWSIEEFAASLTSVAPATVKAYRSDLEAFVDWAGRLGLDSPDAVTRTVLRRYMAHLTTRALARRSIARKASSMRRYFAWLARTGRLPADPSAGLSVPGGSGRLPRVLRDDEITAVLDDPPSMIADDPPAIRSRDDAGAGAPLRQRTARVGGVRPEGRRPRPRAAPRHGVGKGLQAACRPAQRAGLQGPRSVARPRTARARRRLLAGPMPCSSIAAATASGHGTCTGCSTVVHPRRRTPTPCATPSRPTCSTAGPTSGPCKRCSDMRICRRHSTTLM